MRFDSSPPGPIETEARSKLKSLIAEGINTPVKESKPKVHASRKSRAMAALATDPNSPHTKVIAVVHEIQPAMFRLLMNQDGLPDHLDPEKVKSQFIGWLADHPHHLDWRAAWRTFAAEATVPAPAAIEICVAPIPTPPGTPIPESGPSQASQPVAAPPPVNVIPLPLPPPAPLTNASAPTTARVAARSPLDWRSRLLRRA